MKKIFVRSKMLRGGYDEAIKQWGSLEVKCVDEKRIAIGQNILNSISSYGSKVAQINHDTGAKLSFHEIRSNAICVTKNLQKMGFQPGQVFTFLVHRPDHLISILLAAICLGCPINPLHPTLSKEELIRILKITQPHAIFCEANYYSHIDEVMHVLDLSAKVFTFDGKIDGTEPIENLFSGNDAENFPPFLVDAENDIGAILCSSGSTGPSKCVSLSYRTFIPRAEETWMIDEGDVGLCFDSVYWTAGLGFVLQCAQYGATNIITKHSFCSDLQLDLIEKYKVSIFAGIPLNLLTCIKNYRIEEMDLSCIKNITIYGSKAPPYLVKEINRYFPNAKVLIRYGMTEVGRISDRFLDAEECDNVGRLVSGCIAKIVDDQGKRLGHNVTGEICVKKSNKFLGYYKDADATAAATDSEGFFLTGDIGHFDQNGNLFFDDRKRFVITTFYFEGVILPTEMEAHLLLTPDIKEVCVVGIPILDRFELPAAVIVRRKDSSLSQRNVFDMIAGEFSEPSKLRGGVYFVDSLPKTHSGKLNRIKISHQAANMFYIAHNNDPDFQTFLSDFPEDYRKLIEMFVADKTQ